jgi:hypothetical protein
MILTNVDVDPSRTVLTRPSLKGSHRRTLGAIFRHPTAHNLEWSDLVGLIGDIGAVDEKANSEFVFDVAGHRHLMRRPHSKDLTTSEVLAVRGFLMQAGWSAEHAAPAAAQPDPVAPSFLIVVDHHETRVFDVDFTSNIASEHVIRPADPHHFLHHLVHKDRSRERGQRAPEDPAYYEKIAQAVAHGGMIVVVGHGDGKSNAAHHLTEYLGSHHRQIYQRIVAEIDADLSAITMPQLLDLARQARPV